MLAVSISRVAIWFVGALAFIGYSVGSAADDDPLAQSFAAGIPAGHYTLDKTHSSITFAVSHMGFSFYTGSFSRLDATLDFNPARIETASLTATIDVTSLAIPAPPEGFLATLLGSDWFNTREFSVMTYRSTGVISKGPNSAEVTGELTLMGITAPVTLYVTFNGGYPGIAGFDPNARVGFSAHGSLNRSDFGIRNSLPPEGTTMGVGDQVTFRIETEFTGPPLKVSTPRTDSGS